MSLALEVTEHYNAHAVGIWNDYGESERFLPMQLPPLIAEPELLLVGLNPSLNHRWVEQAFNDEGIAWDAPDQHPLHWPANANLRQGAHWNQQLANAIEFEAMARETYQYFRQLGTFVQSTSATSFEHLDVLLMRERDANAVVRGGLTALPRAPFYAAQIALFSATLVALQPRVVLVANAVASRLLLDELLLRPNLPRRTYVSDLLPKTKFILCGMLTGGALDRYSRDRLAADVQTALDG